MHDTTALVRPAASDYTPADNPRFVKLHRRFPTVAYLRRHARRHVPRFAFEYMDGGAGADGGIARNWSALDAVELVPRYGVTTALPPVDIELFGRHYSAPIGVAPMGGPSIVWPGADQYLAAAAQRARVPYTLGLVGGMTVERAAEIAPDVLWFQLYRCFRNEHAIGFDLVRRAGAHHAPARGRGWHYLAVSAGSAHARRHSHLARLPRIAVETRAAALRQSQALHRRHRGRGRGCSLRAARDGRRLHLGRDRALSRALEASVGDQGGPPPGRRGKVRVARSRRHRGLEPRRTPGRSPAGAHRRASGHCPRRRQPGDRDAGQRRALGARRGASGRGRRRCRVRRQSLSVGPRRARRGRSTPRDRSYDRRDEIGIRPDRRDAAKASTLGRDPPSRCAAVLIWVPRGGLFSWPRLTRLRERAF